ncbi:MAG: hypothetical protein ACK55I_38095, partial [bacterium]
VAVRERRLDHRLLEAVDAVHHLDRGITVSADALHDLRRAHRAEAALGGGAGILRRRVRAARRGRYLGRCARRSGLALCGNGHGQSREADGDEAMAPKHATGFDGPRSGDSGEQMRSARKSGRIPRSGGADALPCV